MSARSAMRMDLFTISRNSARSPRRGAGSSLTGNERVRTTQAPIGDPQGFTRGQGSSWRSVKVLVLISRYVSEPKVRKALKPGPTPGAGRVRHATGPPCSRPRDRLRYPRHDDRGRGLVHGERGRGPDGFHDRGALRVSGVPLGEDAPRPRPFRPGRLPQPGGRVERDRVRRHRRDRAPTRTGTGLTLAPTVQAALLVCGRARGLSLTV